MTKNKKIEGEIGTLHPVVQNLCILIDIKNIEMHTKSNYLKIDSKSFALIKVDLNSALSNFNIFQKSPLSLTP